MARFNRQDTIDNFFNIGLGPIENTKNKAILGIKKPSAGLNNYNGKKLNLTIQ